MKKLKTVRIIVFVFHLLSLFICSFPWDATILVKVFSIAVTCDLCVYVTYGYYLSFVCKHHYNKSLRVFPAGNEGWGQIPGPGSIYDRLNIKKGLPPIEDMPNAFNIEIVRGKL